MNNLVVVGCQWGDEGKGKLVDYLGDKADIIVRFQGGNNAGHTIVTGDKIFKLSLLPSGILRDNKLSIFQQQSVCEDWKPCFYAIHYPGQGRQFFTVDRLPELFSLVTANGYTIDTQLTQMINQSQTVSVDGIICFISYNK